MAYVNVEGNNMKHSKCIWLLIATLAAIAVIAPSSFSQARERNLAEYKQGPLFDLRNEYFPEGNQEVAPARQFLWELWSSRTKGFFDITSYSREGDPTTCSFFVEPDSSGRWRVVSECKYKGRCPYISKKKCREFFKTIYTASYDVVERIEYADSAATSSRINRTRHQIPNNEDRNPLSYVVIFRDSSSGREDKL